MSVTGEVCEGGKESTIKARFIAMMSIVKLDENDFAPSGLGVV
jgi:hypothetical protein